MTVYNEIPHTKFQDDAQYNFGRGTVDFTLLTTTCGLEERIVCRVSEEALKDYSGKGGGTKTETLDLSEQFKNEVRRAVGRKFFANLRERDGSILIQIGEIKPD